MFYALRKDESNATCIWSSQINCYCNNYLLQKHKCNGLLLVPPFRRPCSTSNKKTLLITSAIVCSAYPICEASFHIETKSLVNYVGNGLLWVHHSCSLVPHLIKKLSKLRQQWFALSTLFMRPCSTFNQKA